MVSRHKFPIFTLLTSVVLLVSCEQAPRDNAEFLPSGSSTQLTERDVEAPEIFQESGRGLWNGNPTTGGAWVSHSAVSESGRAIVRNPANGTFVVGDLLPKQNNGVTTPFEVSSDAAQVLGMLPGQAVTLNVTALRRDNSNLELVPIPFQAGFLPPPVDAPSPTRTTRAAASVPASTPAVTPPTAPVVAGPALRLAYVQVGAFSLPGNAFGLVGRLSRSGLQAQAVEDRARGKTLWRVIVGPARTIAERNSLLRQVRQEGFPDAYFVRS